MDLRLLFWRRPVEPTALEQRDAWITWMRLDGKSETTINGYRQITDRFLVYVHLKAIDQRQRMEQVAPEVMA